MTTIDRPALRYAGGKWQIAEWIIAHLPSHTAYVEPFGGGASVLLRKPRVKSEVYNDLDHELVNFFRILRDQGPALRTKLEATPFARSEFQLSYEPTADPLEQARRTVVRSFFGHGSSGHSRITGFRSKRHTNNGCSHAVDWVNYQQAIPFLVERLQGVVIECRDALDLIRLHDGPDVLFYIDPPYVRQARQDARRLYRHEYADDDHRALAEVLRAVQGSVVLSGYDCPLYQHLFGDWTRLDRAAYSDARGQRVESLWFSRPPACLLGLT